MRTLASRSIILAAALGLASAGALGQIDLTWNTVGGGGATYSTGNGYELGGTLGQTGAETPAGGGFVLTSGFWFYDSPPMLSLPADASVSCEAASDPNATGLAASADDCDGVSALTYSDSTAPGSCPHSYTITRTWTVSNPCGYSISDDQIISVVDASAPALTRPVDKTVYADAGGCTAMVAVGSASALDNCDGSPTVAGVRDDLLELTDPYPAGVTHITWTATDACGNSVDDVQTITVQPFSHLLLDAELFTVSVPSIERCISLELIDCSGGSQVVTTPVTFTNGAAAAFDVLVPCGDYTCLLAHDPLHTLARRLDRNVGLNIAGTNYVAAFADTSGSGGSNKALVGGDFNEDNFIDIIDFAIYVNRYGHNYGSGDSGCSSSSYNGDASGDGLVATEDFSFIQTGFLSFGDDTCCSARPHGQPRRSITLDELATLGLSALAPADLNHDHVIDEQDIAAYLAGQLPGIRPLPEQTKPAQPVTAPEEP